MLSAMRFKRCCVPGCDDKITRRFSIPAEERLRNVWLARIENPVLDASRDKSFFKSYKICGQHFHNMCLDPASGFLLRYSVPTLRLSAYNEPSTPENCFSRPLDPFEPCRTPERVRKVLAQATNRFLTGASATPLEDAAVMAGMEATPSTAKASSDRLIPSSAMSEWPPARAMPAGVAVSPWRAPTPSPSTSAVVAPASTPRKKKGLLCIAGVTRKNHLSPDASKLYARAKLLNKIAAGRSARKLKRLQKCAKTLNELKNTNRITSNFFLSQQRTQRKKPKGRRFTVDDKVLALSIYKQSGKAYRFLSHIFSLPSRNTLSALLNKIPFNVGINEAVFEHLKRSVRKLSAVDRCCVLMFDEVALEAGLTYNQRNDSVEGFVDFGGSERRTSFADHALVLMAKGIHKKWKMPVCFTFCESTTPTPVLMRILKDVTRQLRQTGLDIVASISDQGSTNQAAVNGLMQDTSRQFALEETENRCQGYLIDDEEIVHLYDFPHLMKGIRNSLLDKDLHYTQDGVEKVASWKHVVQNQENDTKYLFEENSLDRL